jgi:hypothetical protein
VSYKTRESKRRRKTAQQRSGSSRSCAERNSRAPRESSDRYWLTIVDRTTCCARPACHGILRKGREMVFRKTPQESLCVACADRAGIRYRPSRAWEDSKRVKARKSSAWMREPSGASR